MELLKHLDEKLIAELIPEVGPRIIFMSYWKRKYSEKMGPSTSSDTETYSTGSSQQLNNINNEKFQNTMQGTSTYENNNERKKCKHNAPISQDMFLLGTMPSIDDLLQRSKTGRIILCSSITKELTGSMRNKLCNIIVTYMEDHNIAMTNKIAKGISERIVKIFPSEAEGTYFIQGKRKINTLDKKSIAAKGKLMSCWRNRKYALSKLKGKSTQEHEADNPDDFFDDDDVSNEDIKKAWLKVNQAPWEIVMEKWSLTSKYRLQVLTKSSDKILSNIFEDWPLFKHPYGYKLIKLDFDEAQLTNFCLTLKKWNEFFNVIKQNVQFTSSNDDLIDLIEKLKLDISEDSKLAITIQLLSYMIPPKQKVKQKGSATKKHYNKASIALSRDSMIKYVATSADITKIRQEASDQAKEIQTSVQPYVIVVGTIENVAHSYVTIDDVLYSTESTLEVFDVCFKAFHVLKINYPDASKHLWTLIQKGLYQFQTQWDISFSNTEHLLKKLTTNTT